MMDSTLINNGQDNSAPESNHDDLALVLTTSDQILMEMVKGALEGEGIVVLLKSAAGYHSRGMLPFAQGFFDYRLLVSTADERRARDIVETIIPPEELK
jgi:hypothetical protein